MVKVEITDYDENNPDGEHHFDVSIEGAGHQIFNEFLALCQQLDEIDAVGFNEQLFLINELASRKEEVKNKKIEIICND